MSYDRAVGYFSSSVFALVGLAYANFASRQGRLRLICSPFLSSDDVRAIDAGYSSRDAASRAIMHDLDQLLDRDGAREATRLLAVLIRDQVLQIKLAFRLGETGIFHDKVGILQDGRGDVVSFIGSANESLSAWDWRKNHESFEVFCSWKGAEQAERTTRHLADFDSLWAGRAPGLEIVEFPNVARERLVIIAGDRSMDDSKMAVREAMAGEYEVAPAREVGHVTPPKILQRHQADVLGAWHASGLRGIIDHVTGAGKTVTALSAVRDWIGQGRPALILVPSQLLLGQWLDAINVELAAIAPRLLLAGAGALRSRWESALGDFTRNLDALGPRIVLATMDTAATEDFISRINGGDHLLIIADEVHRVGATSRRRLTEVKCGAALGLSATPERYGDSAGTAAIHAGFGHPLPPRFGIPQAIAAGRLVPYDYFVYETLLTAGEGEKWHDLTVKIRQEFARFVANRGNPTDRSERVDHLLHQRAALAKRATNKTAIAVDVLHRHYRTGDRWLVYCDTTNQLNDIAAALRALSLPTLEFHSNMEDSGPDTLRLFSYQGGILVSIRCLDEGVDIPAVDRALILASSRNRREFIQRRGRVLRTSPGKYFAEIHDVLVLGMEGEHSADTAGLASAELSRADEFAQFARNTAVQMRLIELRHRFVGTMEDEAIDSDVETDTGG